MMPANSLALPEPSTTASTAKSWRSVWISGISPRMTSRMAVLSKVILTASGRPVFALQGELPAYRDLVPGISGDDVLQLAASVAQRIGLRHLRERLHPREVTPEPGVFDWGKYLKSAQAQHAAGIQILEMIHSWPEYVEHEAEPTPQDAARKPARKRDLRTSAFNAMSRFIHEVPGEEKDRIQAIRERLDMEESALLALASEEGRR